MGQILLDTSALVALAVKTHPKNPFVVTTIARHNSLNHNFVIAPQCLYELFVVATRPTNVNRLGKSPNDVIQDLELFEQAFPLIPDPPDIVQIWKRLVGQHQVSGKPAHDARLVAWMEGHSIHTVFTLNPKDFDRYGPAITYLSVS